MPSPAAVHTCFFRFSWASDGTNDEKEATQSPSKPFTDVLRGSSRCFFFKFRAYTFLILRSYDLCTSSLKVDCSVGVINLSENLEILSNETFKTFSCRNLTRVHRESKFSFSLHESFQSELSSRIDVRASCGPPKAPAAAARSGIRECARARSVERLFQL